MKKQWLSGQSGGWRMAALSVVLFVAGVIQWTRAAPVEEIKPRKVASGAYPHLAVDAAGDLHLVYVRDGRLRYRRGERGGAAWSDEQDTGLPAGGLAHRSRPRVVVDSSGRPHALVGSSYARSDGSAWSELALDVTRDTGLALDSRDNVYVARRGGHHGGYLGLLKGAAGAEDFAPLPDPDTAAGFPAGRNNHVYGFVFTSPVDDSVHVVYRHGTPTHCAYRVSYDGGKTWLGGGVSNDDAEAPSGLVAPDGTVLIIGGAGVVHRRSGGPGEWESWGRALQAGRRDQPVLALDSIGRLYAACFGGRINVRLENGWAGEARLPGPAGNPLGFVSLAPARESAFVYAVWEEGAAVNNDHPAGESDILFAPVSAEQIARSAQLREPASQVGLKEKKALFIILDGISADVLEMIDTPALDAIAGGAGYTRAYVGGEAGGYSESPTVSAVGYNHVLTGTWSNKHNVYDNDIENPNYNYWNLFRLLKHNHPGKQTAIYSSWLDNRTKLVGDGLPEAGDVSIDIHYDGFELDTAAFPHEPGYVQDIDDLVSTKAAESIRKDGPALSWVYLWYPDDAGHRYGDGDEYNEAVRVADAQVGTVWEAVRYRMEHHGEDWLVVVTTDHGRRLPDGKDHGGQTERERTVWIVTNAREVNAYFAGEQPGVVDIYPTISRFMDLEIPADLERELDGVPLIGPLSISSPAVSLDEDSGRLSVDWKAWEEDGAVNIWVSTTNHYREGGEDRYQLLAVVPLKERQASVDVSSLPSGFYKVALEARHNTVNRWVAGRRP